MRELRFTEMREVSGGTQPGSWDPKPTNSNGSEVGQLSSAYTSNGQGVGGVSDQATSGQRSANIQMYLGHS
jgi:hypothetical protein